jgi:S1-C subfamily serine protease
MLRKASLAILAALALCISSTVQRESVPPPSDSVSARDLFKRLSPSVFVVETFDAKGAAIAFGSGISVATDEVVTNRHVVEEGKSWRVRQGENTWAAKIAYLDAEHDLCGLKVTGLKCNSLNSTLRTALARLHVSDRDIPALHRPAPPDWGF